MFNLGFGELAVILVILLLVVGPSRLPTLMKSTGKGIRTLRQASRDIQTSIGLEEMMREDVLQPPRRTPAPRPVPPTDSEPQIASPSAVAANAPVDPPAAVGTATAATDAATTVATAPDPEAPTRGNGTPT